MAQPKRRWSKARTHAKRSTWKKEQPTFQHAHIVMNQYYHTEFVEIADIMMENKLLQKKNLKMHNY